jgi:hypothetical protein
MGRISIIIVAALLVTASCNNKQKNEEVKEDAEGRMEKVGKKVDEGVDKMKEQLEKLKDTVKSKLHRATAPDSTH